MRFDIIIPTLGRPHALAPLVENIEDVTPSAHSILFVLDPDDGASRDAVEALVRLSDAPIVSVVEGGSYPHKTNAGVNAGEGDAVVLTADDVVFHRGWDAESRRAFSIDHRVEVVGTSDTTPATADGSHATMPVVRRRYIEHPGAALGEPGVAFHEGYHHNFVETELWQLALARGVARFEPRAVIEHRHPCWGTAEVDDTYRKGAMSGWEDDEALFRARAAQWSR